MPLVGQLVHQRLLHLDPLVLKVSSLKILTPTPDRDQPDSRRFEPSSRAALMGEQPNPWELLHPQDATSRPHNSIITNGADYTFFLSVILGF